MASKILLKKSTTASQVPTTSDVDVGEVAVNTEDKRLFTQDNGGSVVELGTTPSSITTTGTVQFGSLSDGTVTVTAFADEDDMSSDSATLVPTQQSVKAYVDTQDATKLNLSGGTMSGAIAMGTNKITGLGDPTSAQDAATKTYVDTEITNLIGAAPDQLNTLNEIAAAINDDHNVYTTLTNSIATKAPLASPALTGTPTAPTAAADTNTTQVATTAYVQTEVADYLPLAGGTLTGDVALGANSITTSANPTLDTELARKAYVDTMLPLSGGTMTGAIDMGSSKVTTTYTPTDNADLTTKTYVDGILGSATAAATSATNAATSETNAATSATNAATSATNAATSATNAEAAYDDFDDRYLGAKATAPGLDNDSQALITGALYFDTTAGAMYVYDGSAWDLVSPSATEAQVTNILQNLTTQDYGLITGALTATNDYGALA